ncbi:MAG TPA: DNA polymerase IV [Bacilli bacterium]|nr:DNA polymerase IV [Bacilli bacterium]
MKEKVIFLVDMQSFYASVEKADKPHLKNQPVIVSGDPERRSGVVLAACPLAKKYGVKNAARLWEAQQKCPHAIILRPRMQHYLNVSLHITRILEMYSDLVEPYSIDEQFVDITGSQRLFGSPVEIAQKIQKAILEDTGVYARIGIGENKVLAKMACDNFAKKNATGIFTLKHSELAETLWPLPLQAMYGIGSRMERNLKRLGIRTVGQLAKFPLEKLVNKWGIPGHVLWQTANGIDSSPVQTSSFHQQKAIGHGMTLPRDYSEFADIRIILLELSEEVCHRARMNHVIGETVHVGTQGADYEQRTGFYRQQKMLRATNDALELFKEAESLFLRFWDREPIRRLNLSLSSLSPDNAWQLSLFDSNREKKIALAEALDSIRYKYGETAIVRTSSLLPAAQAFERAKKIGGHYK